MIIKKVRIICGHIDFISAKYFSEVILRAFSSLSSDNRRYGNLFPLATYKLIHGRITILRVRIVRSFHREHNHGDYFNNILKYCFSLTLALREGNTHWRSCSTRTHFAPTPKCEPGRLYQFMDPRLRSAIVFSESSVYRLAVG